MSLFFPLKTEGQTESANTSPKQYLKVCVNYEQDNCVNLLTITKFEADSDWHSIQYCCIFLSY